MSWLMNYQDDLAALEEARNIPIDLNDEAQIKKFSEEFKTVLAPLADGSLDAGDAEAISDLWWQKFKASEIAAARGEVAVLHRLAPLFAELQHASDTEWEEYALIRMRARLNSKQMQQLWRMFAKSEATTVPTQPPEGGQ